MYLTIIWLLLGLILAVAFLVTIRVFSGRSEKQLIGIGLLVAALVYVGFSVDAGASDWLFIEIGGVFIYGLFFWLAMRYSPLWLAVGWGLHPIWDIGLHLVGSGHTFSPEWYVIACVSFDLLVAGYVVYRFGSWPAKQPSTNSV